MQNYVRNAIVIVIVAETIQFFRTIFIFIYLLDNFQCHLANANSRKSIHKKSVLKFVNLGRILFFFSWKLKNWHRELYQMNRKADECHVNVSMFKCKHICNQFHLFRLCIVRIAYPGNLLFKF